MNKAESISVGKIERNAEITFVGSLIWNIFENFVQFSITDGELAKFDVLQKFLAKKTTWTFFPCSIEEKCVPEITV